MSVLNMPTISTPCILQSKKVSLAPVTAAMFPVVARSCGICREEGYDEVGEREDGCAGESSRYRDGSCASAFAWRCTCGAVSIVLSLFVDESVFVEIVDGAKAAVPYLMVLPVLRRIH